MTNIHTKKVRTHIPTNTMIKTKKERDDIKDTQTKTHTITYAHDDTLIHTR